MVINASMYLKVQDYVFNESCLVLRAFCLLQMVSAKRSCRNKLQLCSQCRLI